MEGVSKMKRMKKILACVLAGAALLTATGCSGSQDPKRLLVEHGHGDWHPVHIGLSTMCDEMEKETDYTFDIYPNGQLGDDSAMIQLVKAGVLDVAKVSAGALEQFNQAYSIFSIPYVFQSTEHYFDVMNNSEAVQEIFESTRKDGFIAIGWFDSGARSIYTTKDGPAATPADLKGLKISTMNSPTSVSMINAMGAAATPMSSGEVYTSLQQGIIDGAENNETVLVDDGHGEVAKSYTYTQHQYLPDIVIISTETWDSMTEEEQNDLRKAMKDAWQAHETEWNKIVERNKTGAKEMGVQFYEIDKTAFIEVMCTAIMGYMVLAVCWQVITRFVLKNPSTVTEEILRYLLVWTTMVGGAYAYGRRKHLSINMLAKKLPPRAQKLLDIFVQAVVIAFCVVVMIVGDLRLVETTFDQISSALRLPMPYVYASILVGGVLIIFYAIIFIFEDIKAMRELPQTAAK